MSAPYKGTQDALETPFELTDSFFELILQNNLQKIEELLKSGVDPNQKDSDGFSALSFAIAIDRPEVVKLLIQYNLNFNEEDINGFTPLENAIVAREESLVRFLLKHGANVNSNKQGKWSPLMLAVEQAELNVVRTIINAGADINYQDDLGYNALMVAAYHGKYDVAKFLLERGAKIEQSAKDNINSLIIAVLMKHQNLTRVLLEHSVNQGFVNTQDTQGRSPLLIAVANNDYGLTHLLLSYGANINVQDIFENTALMVAVSMNNLQITKLLLETGIDSSIVNKEGRSVLDMIHFLREDLEKNIQNTPQMSYEFLELKKEEKTLNTIDEVIRYHQSLEPNTKITHTSSSFLKERDMGLK